MNKESKIKPVYVDNKKISVQEFIRKWSQELFCDENAWLTGDKQSDFDAFDFLLPMEFTKSIRKNLNIKTYAEELIDQDFDDIKPPETAGDDQAEAPSIQIKSEKYKHELINKTINLETKHSNDCDHNIPLARLTVQIFKPTFRTPKSIKLDLDRELQVLSCQPLSVLRDSYFCLNDVIQQPDYSERPTDPMLKIQGHQKMGFFFIDNTFYYDDRNANESLDSVVHWAQSQTSKCSKEPMTKAKFQDLKIILGYPYLYMHQGNCEHLVVFTDIQLYLPHGPSDDSPDDYPKQTIMEKAKIIKCQMCSIYRSKWVIFHNKRLPYSPFYFCHNCHVTFNYDANHKKIGFFQAFPLIFSVDDKL